MPITASENMTAENWIIIKQVFDETLKLAKYEREYFLAKSDLSAEMKEEVKSLLEFEAESEFAPNYRICKQSENSFLLESQKRAIKSGLDKIAALMTNK